MNIFNLPDLDEGLTDVEIVEWLVKVGDNVELDQPLVAVETAKAIVEIPSPQKGRIVKLYGKESDIVLVNDPLIEFESNSVSETPTTASGQKPPKQPKVAASQHQQQKQDTGTVVGKVESSNNVVNDKAMAVGHTLSGSKATPAVRALAHRMDVDLGLVTPTGPNDTITASDVQRVAKIFSEVGPLEPLRGVRRAMAKTMAKANAEVVPVTIYDDADIDSWKSSGDLTMRVVRAIVCACEVEPALNAWYDSHAMGRRVLKNIDLGIAVDTADGLFVPVLRDVGHRESSDIREALDEIKQSVRDRNIPPEAMRGYTITLSNFGVFAGRYANPIVVPPSVAILGTGKTRQQVIACDNQAVIHWILPLSLTFDHRAVTGGEATRFIGEVIANLQLPN